jgi:hypothetical protein
MDERMSAVGHRPTPLHAVCHMGMLAFPLVYFAGLALVFSSDRATRIGGVFLCVAGFIGTVSIGPGDYTLLPAVGMVVVSALVCAPLWYVRARRKFENVGDRACPKCGRSVAATTLVCPRCNERMAAV